MIESFGAVSDRHETLSLRYRPGATADFDQAFRESAEEESRLRMTVVGPHRDDFQLYLNAKPADLFASEGQQRTVAIALKLAQAKTLELEFKKPPLLLLDDVFGELDLGAPEPTIFGSAVTRPAFGYDNALGLAEIITCRKSVSH